MYTISPFFQNLPYECTIIVKVAWFAVYISGNLLVVQIKALGGSGDIGVVNIIGAPHPELLWPTE